MYNTECHKPDRMKLEQNSKDFSYNEKMKILSKSIDMEDIKFILVFFKENKTYILTKYSDIKSLDY